MTASKTHRDRTIYAIVIFVLFVLAPHISSAATFGYTSAGASAVDTENVIHGSRFTQTTEDAVVFKLYAYSNVTTVSKGHTGAIYSSSLNKIANGNCEGRFTSGAAAWDWGNYPGPTYPRLSASTEYAIAFAGADGSGSHFQYYDTGTTSQGFSVAFTYNSTLPDPISGQTDNNRVYSMYAVYFVPSSGTEIITKVSASADDAFESGGTVTINGTSGLVDASTEYHGFRFQNITIPQGATINVAYLLVYVSGFGSSDEPLHRLWGDDSDDGSQFTTGANNISGRTKTTASVDWNNANIGQSSNYEGDGFFWGGQADIKGIIQEIVDRGGWSSGNSIVLFDSQPSTDANRDLQFSFYDGNTKFGAVLYVTYTASGSSTPLIDSGAVIFE